ncbi:hypothetical protein BD289DRAFT_286521 [Coniella lustricola]|uniref:Uncharacterized protein n=1 Tax=Coniella lustricola TaxID=2025994 RepID=A0A2T3A5S1_9PEZI|nr:hypothetical protein BD289DRAFT_286521 [Coniella lustricola]
MSLLRGVGAVGECECECGSGCGRVFGMSLLCFGMTLSCTLEVCTVATEIVSVNFICLSIRYLVWNHMCTTFRLVRRQAEGFFSLLMLRSMSLSISSLQQQHPLTPQKAGKMTTLGIGSESKAKSEETEQMDDKVKKDGRAMGEKNTQDSLGMQSGITAYGARGTTGRKESNQGS